MKFLSHILLLLVCFSCSDLKENDPHPNLFQIYLGDNQMNQFVFDIQRTSDSFILFSAISKKRMNNKFDGDEGILILEVDEETGQIKREKYLELSPGFPSNVVVLEDRFLFFYNNNSGSILAVTVKSNPDAITININDTIDCSNCKANRVRKRIDNGNYLLLGIIEQPESAMSIVEVNDQYSFVRDVQTVPFNRERFGGNNANFVSVLDNYIDLVIDKDISGGRLLYRGPMSDKMVLSHIGESKFQFFSNSRWIGAFEQRNEDTDSFSIVLREDDQIFFGTGSLESIPTNRILEKFDANISSLLDLDPNAKIFLKESGNDEIYIIGTAQNGHSVIYRIKNGELTHKEFGDNSRLDVGGCIEKDGILVIAGSTTIQGKLQRPFIIKAPENLLDN